MTRGEQDRDRWFALTAVTAGDTVASGPLLLDWIREGIVLRRRADWDRREQAGQAAGEYAARIAFLQQEYERQAESLGPEEQGASSTGEDLARWLEEDQSYLTQVMTVPLLSWSQRAELLDRFRWDLRWLGGLISMSRGGRSCSPQIVAELLLKRNTRLLRQLDIEATGEDGAELVGLYHDLERAMLTRRFRSERAAATGDDEPAALWLQRWELSRLEAQLASLDGVCVEEAGEHAQLRAMSERREALAREAEAGLAALSGPERGEAVARLGRMAQSQGNEILADLEDLSRSAAVATLALARGDFECLARTVERLLKLPGVTREETSVCAGVRSRLNRIARFARNEWQEKVIADRLEQRFGRRFPAVLENLVLLLILVVSGLIGAEMILEVTGRLTPLRLAVFSWADLAICTVFLFEFFLKLSLAPERWLYLRRHFVVDLLASIPFGFITYQMAVYQAAIEELARGVQLLRLLRFGRLARPILRLGRLLIFSFRLLDRLVRRFAAVFNQNIVFFELDSAAEGESSQKERYRELRRHFDRRSSEVWERLGEDDLKWVLRSNLADLRAMAVLPVRSGAGDENTSKNRVIPVESVVERLVDMSAEQLLEEMGPGFVDSLDRYIRLFDLPLVRHLPIIRSLLEARRESPAEGVALASNYVGQGVQWGLNLVYFVADLQGTISPPLFLDRLGTTLVKATERPARRLLMLGGGFFLLFILVNSFAALYPVRAFTDKIQALLGWPVIVLGLTCLVLYTIGEWFRRIANQATDFCDRVAEAQYATQTRRLKVRQRGADLRFLQQRVLAPEIVLRTADDRPETRDEAAPNWRNPINLDAARASMLGAEERAFLRNIELLYEEYAASPPFHRNDTQTTTQLLGNLALDNLRRSNLAYCLGEGRQLERLDLGRAAGVLGGPYLWFTYITRIIVQETARRLVDFNRHAMPLDRLACASAEERDRYVQWLSKRLGVSASEIDLPESIRPLEEPQWATRDRQERRGEPQETVEFAAIDFLSNDPARDREVTDRFGAAIAALLRQDRQRIIRNAFRSFPLHMLPETRRTVNLLAFYEQHLAGGRILLLPLKLCWWSARGALGLVIGVNAIVQHTLNPTILEGEDRSEEPFSVALRKVHRMRKPAFMESLRLRAKFDVEYLGLALPTAPFTLIDDSLLERDLDFIGANRRDRRFALRARKDFANRLEEIEGWLREIGWTFERLPEVLEQELPHLADRSGEALRALVTAFVVDYDDVYTLAQAIDVLRRFIATASDTELRGRQPLPPGLVPRRKPRHMMWRPIERSNRPWSDLLDLPCLAGHDPNQRDRIVGALYRHRRRLGPWVELLLNRGEIDPLERLKHRLRGVLLRTDLWSDQILILRAVQTLSLLDVHHYCELVWELGGYEGSAGGRRPASVPLGDRHVSASHGSGRPSFSTGDAKE